MDNESVKRKRISQLLEFVEAFVGEVERPDPNLKLAAYYRDRVIIRLRKLLPHENGMYKGFDLNTQSDQYVRFFCNLHGFNYDAIMTRCRKSELVEARQFMMWILKKHSKLSLSQIGATFNRDHATVLHSLKIVEHSLSLKKSRFDKFL